MRKTSVVFLRSYFFEKYKALPSEYSTGKAENKLKKGAVLENSDALGSSSILVKFFMDAEPIIIDNHNELP